MVRDDEAFENLLRAWGRCYGERPEYDSPEDARAPDVHPLAVAMRFAPGKRTEIIRQRTTMDRGGVARRTLMAERANEGVRNPRMRVVPASYVDPVPCSETKRAFYGFGEVSRPAHPELQRVERAVLDLQAIEPLRGLVMRVNYCSLGPHEEKAERVAAKIGQPVKLRRYRDELLLAKVWVHGRIAA